MSKRYERTAANIVAKVEAQDSAGVDLDELHQDILRALEDAEQEGYDDGLADYDGDDPDCEACKSWMDPEHVLQLMSDAGLCSIPANERHRTAAAVTEILRDLEYKKYLVTTT